MGGSYRGVVILACRELPTQIDDLERSRRLGPWGIPTPFEVDPFPKSLQRAKAAQPERVRKNSRSRARDFQKSS